MLVHPDERIPLARLLQFLEHGERLAHDCARAQAALAPDARIRGFLSGQARQEALHTAMFRGAVAWVAARHLAECPLLPLLERYRDVIAAVVRTGQFEDAVLTVLVILESLGAAVV